MKSKQSLNFICFLKNEKFFSVVPQLRAQQLILPPLDVIINTVSEYVRNLPDTRNLDAVARDVFKSSTSRTEEKIRRFKACVEYYWYGTREAWARSRGKGQSRIFIDL